MRQEVHRVVSRLGDGLPPVVVRPYALPLGRITSAMQEASRQFHREREQREISPP
jgi:hypothetical protein